MNTILESIDRQFTAIGARLVIRQAARLAPGPMVIRAGHALRPIANAYDLNIAHDKKHGEHFRLIVTPDVPVLRILQANRAARHLLLHAAGDEGGERFLCGHDERHWFVAAIGARVSSVTEAKRALLPNALVDAGLTPDLLARRHTEIFKRQGEWFFVPTDRDSSGFPIHHQEPLVRGRGSKPHICSEIVRFGGTAVVLYRGSEYSETDSAAFLTKHAGAFGQHLMKDPETYARGYVRHPDHATLQLPCWHRVYPNREARSANLSFYD